MAAKTTGNGATGTTGKEKPVYISKVEAVRRAMAKLGLRASRGPIRDYVKTHFGIEISPDHVSTCKADILRKKAAKAKSAGAKAPAAKPPVGTSAAREAPVAKSSPPVKSSAAAGHSSPSPATAKASVQAAKNGSTKADAGINLKDILAVKDLVGRVGAGQLKTLIDAFLG
jgi:hypothetical protein